MRVQNTFVQGLVLMAFLWVTQSFAAAVGSTQTASAGGVAVKATYLAQTEHESRFTIALDTHSVNLDAYDLKALSILRDDTGLVLQPTVSKTRAAGIIGKSF